MSRTDTASMTMSVTPQQVFDALLSPDALAQWIAPSDMSATIEDFTTGVGGGYVMTLTYAEDHAGAGKTTSLTDRVRVTYVEIDRPVLVRQEARFDTDREDLAGIMTVTWSMEPSAHGTHVRVEAADVPPGIPEEDHIAGLTASLENLQAYLG